MFNSITKKLKGDASVQNKSQDLEGFICPICMSSFVSPEMVQQHFDEKHPEDDGKKPIESDVMFSPTTQRKESIRDIQENLNDLRQSLDEEVWFNKELKKECSRLDDTLKEKEKEILSRDKIIGDYMKQVSEIEAARDTLDNEILAINTKNSSLMAENKTIRSDFRICEEKMAELENSKLELLEINERLKEDKSNLSEELLKLKSSSRVDNDDVEQRLTDQLTEANVSIESLNKQLLELSEEIVALKGAQSANLLDLETKNKDLIKFIENMKTEKSDLVRSNEEIISKYEQQQHNLTNECSDLRNKVDILKAEINDSQDKFQKIKRDSEVTETQLHDLKTRLKDTTDELQSVKSQNKESIQRIKVQEVEILQIKNICSNKDEEIKILQKSSKSTNNELEDLRQLLNVERKAKEDLRSQVEMSDAANVIMEQLQLEKKNLQQTIDTIKKQMEEEIDRMNGELSESRLLIQSQKEEILNLTSLLSDKEEKVKESEKNNYEVNIACEKYQQKVNEEILNRSSLEDQLVAMTRNCKNVEDSLNATIESHISSKKELEISLRSCEKERETAIAAVANLTKEMEIINFKASKVEHLQKELDFETQKASQLAKDQDKLSEDKYDLLNTNAELKKNEEKQNKQIVAHETSIKDLETQVKNLLEKMESQSEIIKSKNCFILGLEEKVNESFERNKCLDAELINLKNIMTDLKQELNLKNEETLHCRQIIEKSEIDLSKLSEEKATLEFEFSKAKTTILEQRESLTLIQNIKETLVNSNNEKQNIIEDLKKDLDLMSKEKETIYEHLSSANLQLDEMKRFYSESMDQKKLIEDEIKRVSTQLNEGNNRFSTLEDDYNALQMKYSTEEDRVKKETTQLKNHIQALESTLNESSENYEQGRLESAERELTLKSHCEDLESKIVNLTKSIQRTEEDLESEKSLRQTERNNMMEKISQLTNQFKEVEELKSELYQKLEFVETENIESKIRLEAVMDEKDKVLEKIIQMENSMKKQSEGFAKKCREFDQLQSAILDLGRENQSLQITKEKITSRLWIVDDEAVECHNCHKMFSLTNRKHHCRNCGQVFCQDCSAKTATLAVSRKPVRVCDVCHLEVHSHRRDSSTRSSNISLSLTN